MGQSLLARASRELLEAHQLARLQVGLKRILPYNAFYTQRYATVREALRLDSLADLKRFPFTTKYDLSIDQQTCPPFGRNHTYPLNQYIRVHQTSGTAGQPLKVLDTQESWDWWADCWATMYESAGVTRDDIVYLALPFGPAVSFWAAYEGTRRIGALCMSGGSLDAMQRLLAMQDIGATVLVCTPAYALRLAEVACQHHFDLAQLPTRISIHLGEPGASIPTVRRRIEESWHTHVYDHAGLTEVGSYGFSCRTEQGLHVNEHEFIAEIISPSTGGPAQVGEVGELVLTNLGRWGYPALRYRTGDLVLHGGYSCVCGDPLLFLPGGILGRTDDMLIVRGVNVYPATLESILRSFPEVEEYRVVLTRRGTMDEITLRVECPQAVIPRLQEALHLTLHLRVPIEPVEAGTLPRFKGTGGRIEDCRHSI